MLAVLGVVVAGLTLLLIEGSLVYYRLPSTPRWLRDDKSMQATLSSSLTIGIVAAIFLVGQFLASPQARHFDVLDGVIVVAVLAAFFFAWRRLRRFERRSGMGSAPGRVTEDARVVPLPQGSTSPEDPRPAKGSGGRKAA